MKFGAVILAGGKSRRMGKNKAELKLEDLSFLDTLARELNGFEEFLVSVDKKERHPEIRYPMVGDLYADCGPMSGVYSALKTCAADALVAVPCDVPFFSRSLAMKMAACLDSQTDAVIAVTQDGRKHPLCGVYTKNCLNRMEACLEGGVYKMGTMLSGLRVRTCQTGKESWRLQNVNTPEEYERLIEISKKKK